MPFHDISTRALRSALNPRDKAYWHRIIPNHHVGIRMSQTNGESWVSRVRSEKGGYTERTLGRATLLGPNGNGIGYFGFKTALKKAAEFRIHQHAIGVAASLFSLWYNGQLTICPVGNVITVGHALPTGLARRNDDRRLDGPPSKADTMPSVESDSSWPRSNHSLFQGPLLKEIAPKRENAP